MAVHRKSLCVALLGLWTIAFLGLSGCGGGGGGGGDDGGAGAPFLKLVATVFLGQKTPQGTSTLPYPTDPTGGIPLPPNSPTASYQVPAAIFPLGQLGSQTFMELRFNRTVLASSIVSAIPNGSDGIVIFCIANGPGGSPPCVLAAGTPVCMRLDHLGVVDASNTVTNGEAPATVRLYYDPDNNLTTPDVLPQADYALVITNNLQAANGGPFCVGQGSSNCSNSYLPSLPFTVGPNTTPIALSTTTPMVPVSGEAAAPINSEIILNFIDSVDFVSVCAGIANITALDPFISIPFSLGGGAAGNITVQYAAPTDPVTQVIQPLPASLGYVLYMPDPILIPNQVRVRFVDTTNLQFLNSPGAIPPVYQNYASNPQKLPIPSSDPMMGGSTLQLPPIKAVPGSFLASNLQVGPATVTVTVGTGVSDRANLPGGNPNFLVAAFMGTFTWAIGPTLARNPVPPDATFVGSLQGGPPPFDKPGVTVVDTAATTGDPTQCTNVPAIYGPPITGVLTLLPPNDRIANTAILGVPGDLEVGAFMNPAQTITDSPRQTIVPGVLDDQNGTAVWGILRCLNPMLPAPQPPYGNRLYVTDTSSGSLKVFNSFDFSLLTTIPGVASPFGLGISPDLQYLYVSNNLQGTIQRVNVNPASPQFHTVVNTITVGLGPRAVSVQPDNEDVIVCNWVENSISIIRTSTQTERFRGTVGLGPSDALVVRRMLCMGCTAEYLAFIPCLFSNSVSIYESNGGAVLENNPQGRIIASQTGFLGPARGTTNWTSQIVLGPSGLNGPGCFVANTLGSSADRLYLSAFTLSPPPGFPGPPGTRTFVHDPVATTYNNPSDVSIDNMSGLYNVNVVGTPNNKRFCDQLLGGGAPSVLVVSYPAQGLCVAYDYNSPAFFAQVNVPGCDFLQAYYDQ